MKEKEDLTMSHGGTRVHVRGTGPLARPEEPRASRHCLLNPAVIARGGHDDFCICNSLKTLETVQGPGKTPCVIPGWNDNGNLWDRRLIATKVAHTHSFGSFDKNLGYPIQYCCNVNSLVALQNNSPQRFYCVLRNCIWPEPLSQ